MTSKKLTFEALDNNLMDYQNKLNMDYLKECLETIIEVELPNEENTYNYLYSNRTKPYSIVWFAFMRYANNCIKNYCVAKYEASSEHLKAYLKESGYDYTNCFLELNELVSNMRRNKDL